MRPTSTPKPPPPPAPPAEPTASPLFCTAPDGALPHNPSLPLAPLLLTCRSPSYSPEPPNAP
eukprot:3742090-Pleurochrysis_carterae.AAC.1